MPEEFHLSDAELLMALDGELSPGDVARVDSHLAACWECRTRKQEMDGAVREFIHFHRSSLEDCVPPADGPRALLKAQLARLARSPAPSRPRWLRWWDRSLRGAAVSGALLLAATAALFFQMLSPRRVPPTPVVTIPDPSFTPGATVLMSKPEVCRAANVKNKKVPVALQRRVFSEYGIRSAGKGDYELDYLITPALGGADDIRNVWPQSSRATLWTSYEKDALEDRIRELVCDGQLDLDVAQREIARNWIDAYKKYFHTDRPLAGSH